MVEKNGTYNSLVLDYKMERMVYKTWKKHESRIPMVKEDSLSTFGLEAAWRGPHQELFI